MAAKRNGQRTAFNILSPNKKHTQFDYGEIYRHIRTNIEFSTVDSAVKSICLTSTQPYEAKSTTALNLAIIFATKYERVLLIDCDLRKPQLHKYLKLSNKTGLTNALVDFAERKSLHSEHFQKVHDKSFVGELTVLTSGIKIPNPAEILSSETFNSYMQELKKQYDFIIVDCPPISSVSDAVPVGHAVDGTLFICSTQETKRKDAQASIAILKQNNVNLLGSVLTKADTYSHGYGYGYYY